MRPIFQMSRQVRLTSLLNRLYQIVLALFLAFFIAGCDQSKEPDNIDYSKLKLAPASGKPLVAVSESQFSLYLKNGLRIKLREPDDGVNQTADAGGVAAESVSAFSTTNLHELGVDEADHLKFDGEYLFLAENHFGVPQGESQPAVRIMQTQTSAAVAAEVARLENEGPLLATKGIYLHQEEGGKSLIRLSGTQNYYVDFFNDADWRWNSGKTIISLFDVTEQSNPVEEWKIEMEGSLEGSRKIGNKLYLVSRFSPTVEGLNFSAQTIEERLANEALLLQTSVSDLLPHYQVQNGSIEPMVKASDCLLSEETTPLEGFADLVTLMSINVDTREVESSVCVDANLQGIYSSTENFYLGASNYNDQKQTTAIHKFALTEQGIRYRASGEVDGEMGWQDPALRMSEYENDIRLVTTQWSGNEPEHHLFILRENSDNQLQVLASLPNEAEPEPIGKPGEDIFAVRFVEDKAYIVTFETIDPLYQIDLSNPERPKISSAIEMPGFSRYLHPLIPGWILGIGAEAEEQGYSNVKVELYDLLDPLNPQIKDKFKPESDMSESAALFDMQTVSQLWLDEDTLQLTIPISRFVKLETDIWPSWKDKGLYVFEITGFVAGDLSLVHTGSMIVESTEQQDFQSWWSSYDRALIHKDAVYFYYNNQLKSALQTDLSTVYGPF